MLISSEEKCKDVSVMDASGRSKIMNRKQFLNLLAEKTGFYKYQTKQFYDAFVETIMEATEAGDNVTLRGFGTFYAKEYKEHDVVDPRNHKEWLHVPACRRLKFDESITVKKQLNRKEEE